MFKITKDKGIYELVDQKIATHRIADKRVKPLLEAFVRALNDEGGEYHRLTNYSVKTFPAVVVIKDTIAINVIVRRIREPWLPDRIEIEILPGVGYTCYEMNKALFKGSSSAPAVFRAGSYIYEKLFDAGNGTLLTYRISVIDLAYHAFGHGGWYLKCLT